MRFLKQSTAISILIGPFIDDTDGSTQETALDVTTINCDLFKGIAKTDLSLTAAGGDNDCVHVAQGQYSLELTIGNTNTLGHLRISCDVSGAIPIYEDFHVVAANVYDSMFGAATDKLQVDLIQINSDTVGLLNFASSLLGMKRGTVVADALNSQTFFKSNISETNDTHFKDGVIYWESGLLQGQRQQVVSYVHDGSKGNFTITQTANKVPQAGDKFIVI